MKLSDIAKDIKYTKLDSYEGCFVQRADKYSITDNYILIYDRDQGKIRLFNRDGSFIKQISRPGNGPGEYNRPNDVRISHDGEYILIHNQKVVNRYNYDGVINFHENYYDTVYCFTYHQIIFSLKTETVTPVPFNWELKAYGIPNDLDGGSPFWPGRHEDGKLYRLEDVIMMDMY